ncbi:hypothetical protein R6Q57_006449 [Mikania cordata]
MLCCKPIDEAASPTSRATETASANISRIVFDGDFLQMMDIWAVVVLEVYPNSPNTTKTNDNEGVQFLTPESCFMVVEVPKMEENEIFLKKKVGLKLKIKNNNPFLRIFISMAIAVVGIRALKFFEDILQTKGWTGLFRGNLANVIRVAPCKAIELFAYDTVKKSLTPKHGEKSKA